ncbi:neurofilament medium polypeptide, putative [Entamoeba invadens IP1]|uniref:neurofilament medium polypeptide, putative n=1 Tax=Entamoeba invadens IP1 TaxID=370355 RepID=UPI0002C3F9D7|nr:neurofilament medium polypeptide, putative [Entamoeba invadens IP1]ELP94015.1 neurofilament medium polypeptide, putative [Entamoeba invadens IP1]|eukprot:XP_004260786.1 neurofilament medium polypeptide, putative [Entamoeba invadens IP1]
MEQQIPQKMGNEASLPTVGGDNANNRLVLSSKENPTSKNDEEPAHIQAHQPNGDNKTVTETDVKNVAKAESNSTQPTVPQQPVETQKVIPVIGEKLPMEIEPPQEVVHPKMEEEQPKEDLIQGGTQKEEEKCGTQDTPVTQMEVIPQENKESELPVNVPQETTTPPLPEKKKVKFSITQAPEKTAPQIGVEPPQVTVQADNVIIMEESHPLEQTKEVKEVKDVKQQVEEHDVIEITDDEHEPIIGNKIIEKVEAIWNSYVVPSMPVNTATTQPETKEVIEVDKNETKKEENVETRVEVPEKTATPVLTQKEEKPVRFSITKAPKSSVVIEQSVQEDIKESVVVPTEVVEAPKVEVKMDEQVNELPKEEKIVVEQQNTVPMEIEQEKDQLEEKQLEEVVPMEIEPLKESAEVTTQVVDIEIPDIQNENSKVSGTTVMAIEESPKNNLQQNNEAKTPERVESTGMEKMFSCDKQKTIEVDIDGETTLIPEERPVDNPVVSQIIKQIQNETEEENKKLPMKVRVSESFIACNALSEESAPSVTFSTLPEINSAVFEAMEKGEAIGKEKCAAMNSVESERKEEKDGQENAPTPLCDANKKMEEEPQKVDVKIPMEIQGEKEKTTQMEEEKPAEVIQNGELSIEKGEEKVEEKITEVVEEKRAKNEAPAMLAQLASTVEKLTCPAEKIVHKSVLEEKREEKSIQKNLTEKAEEKEEGNVVEKKATKLSDEITKEMARKMMGEEEVVEGDDAYLDQEDSFFVDNVDSQLEDVLGDEGEEDSVSGFQTAYDKLQRKDSKRRERIVKRRRVFSVQEMLEDEKEEKKAVKEKVEKEEEKICVKDEKKPQPNEQKEEIRHAKHHKTTQRRVHSVQSVLEEVLEKKRVTREKRSSSRVTSVMEELID